MGSQTTESFKEDENHPSKDGRGTSSTNVNEMTSVKIVTNENILNRPRSMIWRLIHGISYLLGCLVFLVGSIFYLDPLLLVSEMLAAAGWFYTIGSSLFVIADVQDWWYCRIGCFCYEKYREAYEKETNNVFRFERGTILGCLGRAEVGVNYFLSICGSLLYLAGSILFLPYFTEYLTVGVSLFIAGASVGIASQSWKIFRTGCTNVSEQNKRRFRFKNLFSNIPCLLMDIFSALGALFFLIGSILFLPQYLIISQFGTNRASGLYIVGSMFYTCGAIVLQYYHHCSVESSTNESDAL